jgi:hypothetical protein
MRNMVRGVVLISVAVVVSACASSVPPNRLGDYVSKEKKHESVSLLGVYERPLKAGLILIPDTADPASAPGLPEEALARLGEDLKQEIGRVLPVIITEIVPAAGIRPLQGGDPAQFTELGRKRGLEYLAVVVVSSTEQEYPVTVFLGWTAHSQPGYRTDNWSLLEFALVDLKNEQMLMQAEGRGWATLDRPAAPGINQWYPVVYLRPQDPERRFWPPTYEGAPDTLRVVSFKQAAKRLAVQLGIEWRGVLEENANAHRSG